MEGLRVRPDGFYVDCTLGGGGHSRAILERLGPEGRLLALDIDPEPLEWANAWGGGDRRLAVERLNFAELGQYLANSGLGPADGLVADLGFNSRQVLGPGRGLSFSVEGPLDMRLDPRSRLTAYEIVNTYPEPRLESVLRVYGEERSARKLARRLVEEREISPIGSTWQLAAIVEKTLARAGPRPKIHPATKTFMALRLAANGELESLGAFLASLAGCLKPGGVAAIISFHSLEDRMVKLALRGQGFEAPGEDWADGYGVHGKAIGQPRPKAKKNHFPRARENKIVTLEDLKAIEVPQSPFKLWRRGAITPSAEELASNPRARSARLRVAELV
jgi:16S rRNA (cytosine1402-N4)-methyltransferase